MTNLGGTAEMGKVPYMQRAGGEHELGMEPSASEGQGGTGSRASLIFIPRTKEGRTDPGVCWREYCSSGRIIGPSVSFPFHVLTSKSKKPSL